MFQCRFQKENEQKARNVKLSLYPQFINNFKKGDYHSESAAGNGMKRVFENQKCIEVSLARVYNGSLVLKTKEKSLSKTATFLTSAI